MHFFLSWIQLWSSGDDLGLLWVSVACVSLPVSKVHCSVFSVSLLSIWSSLGQASSLPSFSLSSHNGLPRPRLPRPRPRPRLPRPRPQATPPQATPPGHASLEEPLLALDWGPKSRPQRRCAPKSRNIDQQNKIESPEINPHTLRASYLWQWRQEYTMEKK